LLENTLTASLINGNESDEITTAKLLTFMRKYE